MTAAQLRARVLTEWRGLPQYPPAPDKTKALADLIPKIMGEWGLGDRLREEEVARSWVDIVGEFVGRHAAPQRIQQGVLTVQVLQPTLRYELDRVWKKDILAKLQARFGKQVVRDVKFKIG